MPGGSSRLIVERTIHHAIGAYGDDLVIVYAFRGSEDDPRHVWTAGDTVATTARRTGKPVNVIFVLGDASGSKPPSTEVRESITKWVRLHEPSVGKFVMVLGGEGFGPAIHRAVIGTLVSIFRPTIRVSITVTVREALSTMFQDSAVIEDALQFCERELDVKR